MLKESLKEHDYTHLYSDYNKNVKNGRVDLLFHNDLTDVIKTRKFVNEKLMIMEMLGGEEIILTIITIGLCEDCKERYLF